MTLLITLLTALAATATGVLVIYGMHLGVLAGARLLRAPPPLPRCVPADAEGWPRLTVQLPVYNEPAVVERAIDALAALDYPARRLEVQVLDDSTDETTALVRRRVKRWRRRGVRITHHTRPTRDGFKAGALAAGLQTASGELVAVFDADFVPDPDTLRRLVPVLIADPSLAFVQARWGHVNRGRSWLTRLAAALLDLHFAVEQAGRDRLGWLLSFNGTAGVWRREAIEAAGGWQGDTLAEDLDLSLRARLAGHRGRFVESVTVPAEVPETVDAWRAQQRRWVKGQAEVGRKLVGALWHSNLSVGVKTEATLNMFAGATLPALFAVVALHPVMVLAGAFTHPLWWAGHLGLMGILLAHWVTHRTRFLRGLSTLPLVLVAPFGMGVPAAAGLLEALLGHSTPFVRTPKHITGNVREGAAKSSLPLWRGPFREDVALSSIVMAGGLVLILDGAWTALIPQGAFLVGTSWFAMLRSAHSRIAPRTRGRRRKGGLKRKGKIGGATRRRPYRY